MASGFRHFRRSRNLLFGFWRLRFYGTRLGGKQKHKRQIPSTLPLRYSGIARFRYLFFVFGLYSIVPWTFYTWMPLYLYERLGLSLAGAGFYATVWVQVASILGTLSAGVLADRLAIGTPRARLLVQAAGLMLAGPSLALGVISQGTILLIAGLLCFGFGRAAYEGNVMPSLCPIVRPELRSTAMGFLNLAGCLAGGIMTAIAGAVKQTLGLTAVFQLLGVLMVILGRIVTRSRGPDFRCDKRARRRIAC